MLHVRVFHYFEKVECFFFVLHQRVALAIGAQINARTEVFHLLEVIHPQSVNGLEEEASDEYIKLLALRSLGGVGLSHLTLLVLDSLGKFFVAQPNAPKLLIERRSITRQKHKAQRIDRLALNIQDVVIRQDMLTCIKIHLLDAGLRFFEGARDHFVVDRLILRNTEGPHHALDHVGGKYFHEWVFERHEKLRLSRISLASGAAAELIVNATRFVPLSAKDDETANFFDFFVRLHAPRISTKLDVDAAAGHVGRHRDSTLLTRLRNDLSLALVIFRVQDFMRNTFLLEMRGEQFIFFD